MNMNVLKEYLEDKIKNKISCKVFLDSGTMLQGKINSYDEKYFVIEKCLVNINKMISINPL